MRCLPSRQLATNQRIGRGIYTKTTTAIDDGEQSLTLIHAEAPSQGFQSTSEPIDRGINTKLPLILKTVVALEQKTQTRKDLIDFF